MALESTRLQGPEISAIKGPISGYKITHPLNFTRCSNFNNGGDKFYYPLINCTYKRF